MAVRGHTLDHIAFFTDDTAITGRPLLFAGDTLFVSGCGRLFEGTPAQMRPILGKPASVALITQPSIALTSTPWRISGLPAAGLPQSSALAEFERNAKQARANNKATVPSTLAQEKTPEPVPALGTIQT